MYLCHLRQSVFRIDVFDADIQIPETKVEALLPFPAPQPEGPGELGRKLYLKFLKGHFCSNTIGRSFVRRLIKR